MATPPSIRARPYPFPYRGFRHPGSVALVIIDMQIDFCGDGGYFDHSGYAVDQIREPIPRIKAVLDACRSKHLSVFFTRQGYRADLADLTPYKAWRSRQRRTPMLEPQADGQSLRRDQPGFEIISILAPLPGEPIIDKTANSAFCHTDFETILRARGVESLMFAGVTTDVCVHSTLRDADDRGFECLLLEDCCASSEARFHEYAVGMMEAEGGVFGCVSNSVEVIKALSLL